MDKVKELMDESAMGVRDKDCNQAARLPETTDVYLFGEITDAEACKTVQMIDHIRLYGDKMRLWICSMGGDVGGALAIHDALKRFPGSEAIATGNCQSAALLVLLGAELRWATPNTIFFNHAIQALDRPDIEFPIGICLPAITQLAKFPLGYFDSYKAREWGLLTSLWTVGEKDATAAERSAEVRAAEARAGGA